MMEEKGNDLAFLMEESFLYCEFIWIGLAYLIYLKTLLLNFKVKKDIKIYIKLHTDINDCLSKTFPISSRTKEDSKKKLCFSEIVKFVKSLLYLKWMSLHDL